MFNRHVENGLLDVLADIGVGAAVFSPLQQGLLTDRYLHGVPAGSRATEGRFLTEDQATDQTYLERARGLQEIAASRGQSLAQMALSWVLRNPTVTTALVGASSVAQLEDSVAARENLEFGDDELAAIDAFAVDGTGARR